MPMKLLSRHLETSTERLSSFSNSSLQMSIVTIETCEQSLRRCAEPVLDVFHSLTFQHRIAALVWRCLLGLAPAYIRDLCYLQGRSQPNQSGVVPVAVLGMSDWGSKRILGGYERMSFERQRLEAPVAQG